MDMKKTAKKIGALVTGASMLGATIMGATALDLSSYPAPFVSNGVFSGKIVVGAKAATSDVVGAIDLAASLQADSTSSSEVEVPGVAGVASVNGDTAEFKTGSDVLSIGEELADVKQTFTQTDLEALKAGVLNTGVSNTPVKQYLKFGDTTMKVLYEEDTDNDVLGDFLKVDDGTQLFEYHMEFTEGAESDVDSGSLEDMEDEVVTMLGAPFTITQATVSGSEISLELLGGQVADVLRDGETKTYTIDGVDYEITAVFISEDGSAKLSVNGVVTKELEEGETEVLGDDVTVGIQSVLTNNREGLVEFYLGANKVTMTDSNFNNAIYNEEGSVEVREESVDDEDLIIKIDNVSSTRKKLQYIKYSVNATDDLYVPAGKGLRSFLEDNEYAMLTDTWDVLYTGLVKVGDSKIEFNAKSDYAYELAFENLDGDKYSFPLVTDEDNTYKWGDSDDDFWFTENNNATLVNANAPISDNDYFIVSDRASSTTEDKALTNVLRYQSISTSDSTVTFKDLAGGDIVVSYTGTLGSTAAGELIVGGASHDFEIATNENLRIDLDAAGDVAGGDEVFAVTRGGAILEFGSQTANTTATTGTTNVTVRTPASQFDETSSGPEESFVTVTNAGTEQVDLTVSLDGAGSFADDPEDDDYQRGYTNYGAFFELYSPSGSNEADELTISYPLAQRSAQVFVTAGVVDYKAGEMGADGKLMTDKVNPISVGLAVLDTEAPAVGSAKMIVVGGPCVNTVAAELMGNPADCTAGFMPGKAVIKFFESKNALLVAGYSAQDTLGASYVLADSEDYKLSGSEVEVVVADLNTITVNKVN